MPRRAAVAIALTPEDRATLERNVRRRNGASALAQRSRIVLLAADGLSNRAIAARLELSSATVALWRGRFAGGGLAGLREAPRGGRPRKIDEEMVETVIAATMQTSPEGSARWSTRLLAREMGMSQSAISRIWRASGLGARRHEAPVRRSSTQGVFTEVAEAISDSTNAPAPDRASATALLPPASDPLERDHTSQPQSEEGSERRAQPGPPG